MRLLTVDDILPLDQFKAERQKRMAHALAAIGARRVALGPNMTLLFENRDTARWQIHEMCRVEGITKPSAIAHEVETYNSLIPGDSELSATLLIEYTDAATRTAQLVRLAGIHEHLWLDVDGLPSVQAVFEQGREKETGKVSSVQFVRFALKPAHIEAFGLLATNISLRCSHPEYTHTAALPAVSRGALFDDLRTK